MTVELQALKERIDRIEQRYELAESRLRDQRRRTRVSGGMAVAVVVASILISPANRAAFAQAIDLLGLGDVFLTPAGVRFAEAGVLEEKEVFREQAQSNVQLIQRILKMIDDAPGKRVRWETVLDSLQDCFSEGEAERQLDTAIAWGRYAELFAYDDNEGVFTRDTDDENLADT